MNKLLATGYCCKMQSAQNKTGNVVVAIFVVVLFCFVFVEVDIMQVTK